MGILKGTYIFTVIVGGEYFRKTHELDKAIEMGVCGMYVENSQDLCNWEAE